MNIMIQYEDQKGKRLKKKLTQPQRTMKHYHPCHWNHRRREEIAWCRKNN